MSELIQWIKDFIGVSDTYHAIVILLAVVGLPIALCQASIAILTFWQRHNQNRALAFDHAYNSLSGSRGVFWSAVRREWDSLVNEESVGSLSPKLDIFIKTVGPPPLHWDLTEWGERHWKHLNQKQRIAHKFVESIDRKVNPQAWKALDDERQRGQNEKTSTDWNAIEAAIDDRLCKATETPSESQKPDVKVQEDDEWSKFNKARNALAWAWNIETQGVRRRYFRRLYRFERQLLLLLAWYEIPLTGRTHAEGPGKTKLFKMAENGNAEWSIQSCWRFTGKRVFREWIAWPILKCLSSVRRWLRGLLASLEGEGNEEEESRGS